MTDETVTIQLSGEAAAQMGELPDQAPVLMLLIYDKGDGYDCRFGGTGAMPPALAAVTLRRLALALHLDQGAN